MEIKVNVKLDPDAVADYMIHNIYTSIVGIVCVVLSVLNFGLSIVFVMKKEMVLAVVFFFFTIFIVSGIPFLIRLNIRKKVAGTRRVTETVTYIFTEEGIETITSSGQGKASWKKFKKAVLKKYILVLYADNNQAIILPVEQLGEDFEGITDLICEKMPAPSVRVRKVGKK